MIVSSLAFFAIAQIQMPAEFQGSVYERPFQALQAAQTLAAHSEQGDFLVSPERPDYEGNPGNPGYGPTPVPPGCGIVQNFVDFSTPNGADRPSYPVLYEADTWLDFYQEFGDLPEQRLAELVLAYEDAVTAVDTVRGSALIVSARRDCGLAPLENNKCCDKSGALEKCKDSDTKTDKCAMQGSVDTCDNSSTTCSPRK